VENAAFEGGRQPKGARAPALEEVPETMAKAETNGTAVASKLQPLGDRVVVKASEREETTRGGIVLPDTAKEKPQRGTVIAAGKGRKDDDGDRIEMDVKVGDEVLFAKYAGTEFKLEDEDLLILSEKDILAVISE
jgi:chaperonin GroES